MESVGPYQILERSAVGVLGELFRGRDPRQGRAVALRAVDPVLLPDAASRQALLDEARALQAFSHPGVASVLDALEQDERVWIVYDSGPAEPLTGAGGRRLEVRQALSIALQVADVLAAAAASKILHGALEPSSVLVGTGGSVKVADLGLGHWARRSGARRDPAYAAPEQILGAPGDARSDVFALGIILHEMLAGERPFAADTPDAVELKILQAQAVPPGRSNRAVSPDVDAIVQKALAKSLDKRYTSAAALADELRVAFLGLGPSAAAVRRERATAALRWWTARWPVVAGSFAVLLIAAAVLWFGRNALKLPWKDAEPVPVRPVLLVLPFSVTDNATAYFGPGFAEDLASRLSEVPGATVVGRTSIRDLHQSDWRASARRVAAAFVVRGRVTPGPYSIDTNVELVDVDAGLVRWSKSFSREPRQVSALQAEIAGRIAETLSLATPTSNRWARASSRQIDPAAYDLFLQGRDAEDRRDRSRAIGLYDQALQKDPRLVEARASLAHALYLEEFYAGSAREPAASGRALREAEAALAVDSELPAAHLAAALAAQTTTLSASALARALAFDPSNGEAWHHAGDLVSELDPPKSIAFYRASLALEPGIDANLRDLASSYASAGNQEAALQATVQGEGARPNRPWWKQVRARVALEQSRYDAAVQMLAKDPAVETTPMVWLMGRIVPLTLAGRLADARRESVRLVEKHPSFCEGRAVAAALAIDTGAAAEGRRMAASILADASRAGAEPGLTVCAALAAAGTGDAAEAGSWLARVAGDDRALRLWTRQATFGVGLSFRSRWYPWTKVLSSQPVQTAAGQLDVSLDRLRDEVEHRLPAPPGQR